MAPPLDELDLDGSAERGVALGEQSRVRLVRYDAIRVALDVADRDAKPRERLKPIDRIVLGEPRLELAGRESVRGSRARDSRVARDVADGIDSGDAPDRPWMLDRPGVEHQPAAAAREEDGPRSEAVLERQLVVERLVDPSPVGAAVALPHIDSGEGDARGVKSIDHPLLVAARVSIAERRSVPDPRRRPLPPRTRRRLEDEGSMTGDREDPPIFGARGDPIVDRRREKSEHDEEREA